MSDIKQQIEAVFGCSMDRAEIERRLIEAGWMAPMMSVVAAAKAYITAPSAGYDNEGGWHDLPRDRYDELCAALEAYDGTKPRVQ